MKDIDKSKKQLLDEVELLRQRIRQMETSRNGSGQAGEESHEEKDELGTYLDVAGAMFVVINADEQIRLINKKGCEILGYEQKEILGKNWFDTFLPPRVRDEVRTVFYKLMAGETEPVEYFENAILITDGNERTISWHNTVFRDEAGNITGTLSSGEDITERVQAKEIIRQEKDRVEQYLNIARVMLVTVNADENITMINKKGCEILGYKERELIGKNWFDILVPQRIRGEVREVFNKLMAGDIEPVEYNENQLLTKDGEERLVAFHNTVLRNPNGEIVGTLSSAEDITERKHTEEEVRASGKKYRELAELLPATVCETDVEGNITFVNRNAFKMFGYSPEDLEAGINIFQVITPENRERARENIGRVLGGEEKSGNEYLALRKDGNTFPAIAYTSPIIREEGIAGIRVILVDITGRKRAEESLRESEGKYRALFASSLTGTFVSGFGGVIRDVNKAGAALLGFDRAEDLVGQNILEYYRNPEYRDKIINGVKRGGIHNFEFEMVKRDGSSMTALISSAIVDVSGEKVILTSGQDVTESRQMSITLQENEKRFRELAELLPGAICETDNKGNVTFINRSAFNMFGYLAEDLKAGINVFQMIAPEDRERARENNRQKYRGKGTNSNEYRMLRKDGSSFPAIAYTSLTIHEEGITGIRSILVDITERKQAEEALRESEEKYRGIAERNFDGIITINLEGQITYTSPAVERIHGYKPEELKGRIFWEFIPSFEINRIEPYFTSVMKGNNIHSLEMQLLRKNDSLVTVEMNGSPMVRDGKVIGIQGVYRDITERQQAEEALRESEEKYRRLFEQSRDVVYIARREGGIIDINQAGLDLFGYTSEEMIGMDIRKIYANPDDLNKFQRYIEQEGQVADYELKFCKCDGTEIDCQLTSTLRLDYAGNILGYQGIIRDMTELKQAEAKRKDYEQKAMLSSHMASVGEMASGIAHEINNPLTGVIGYSQLLMRKDIPEDIKNDIKIIHDGSQRVAAIVKGMLTFARQYKPERDYVIINNIITSTLNLRAYALKTGNIKVTTDLDPELPLTIADGSQLQQVFLNIIINAETEIKLAHGRGNIFIKTERVNDSIKISIKDDGPGISRKNIDKIFDPFFTTRTVGQGTGLGLSVCHGIIMGHNGRIYARSKPGKGATFIVELPVVTELERLERLESEAKVSESVVKARMLVVDDEPIILEFLNRILTAQGYKVDTIDNAAAALVKVVNKEYSLILMDIKMPGMSGMEFYDHLYKMDQSLAGRIVFITGDVMGTDTQQFLSLTKATYFTKPFNIEQIQEDIRRLISQPI